MKRDRTTWKFAAGARVCLALVLTGTSGLTMTPSRALAAPAKRPNIVLIFSDDHAYQAISAYADPRQLLDTPNLDRIATQGMRFNRCMVPNSICGPSRATVLTGKYSHLNGFYNNSNSKFDGTQMTFPKLLQAAGYQTAVVGKWHLVSDPTGFDYWQILPGQGVYYNPTMLDNGRRVQHQGYTTDIITDISLDWLKKRDKAKPFLLMCQQKAPHREWEPPLRHLGHDGDRKYAEPATLFDDYSGRGKAELDQDMTIARTMTNKDLKLTPPGQLTPEQLTRWNAYYEPRNEAFRKANLSGADLVRWKYNRYMHDYLGCVKAVDDGVGRLLAFLAEEGLADDTLVIYSADQGFYLGEHGWFDKRWIFEESLRAPLMVRWPAVVKPGGVSNALVSNLDFAETFLDAAGVPVPAEMQGRSLVPLFKGETPGDWRKSFYYHYFEYPVPHHVRPHYGVVTDRYKLVHFYTPDVDYWELFDRTKDPNEVKDVSRDPAYQAVVEELKREVSRLRAELKVPADPPQSAYGNPPAPFGPPAKKQAKKAVQQGVKIQENLRIGRSTMAGRITRRNFIRDTTHTTVGLAVAAEATRSGAGAAAAAVSSSAAFASRWQLEHDRVWLGEDYWSNPLQDWRLAGGRIECVKAALDRNVHLLTRALGDGAGDVALSVRVGRVGGDALAVGRGSFGCRIGVMGPLRDYRNSLFAGAGLDVGATADGGLFIGEIKAARPGTVDMTGASIDLRLTARTDGDHVRVTLAAHDPASGKALAEISRDDLAADRLVGNLALVANFGSASAAPGQAKAKAKAKAKGQSEGRGAGLFWFADWRVSGSKVEAHDDRAFGPILFSQYTLSRGVLKLSAQMPPLGPKDTQTVRLQVAQGETWKTIAEASIDPETRTATFRLDRWDDTKDTPYRVAYLLASTRDAVEHFWTGTIRRDPVDQPVVTVADVSCNTHAAFPNTASVAAMATLDPDLIAFVGDQFYENSGGYGVVHAPLDVAILDYLRKWYLHGWTWRALTRDRPSLSIPDDHDVYQGNIWGEAGAAQATTQEAGGYQMPAAWVNVVNRTQTAHHPDAYDPTPIKQGMSVFYAPLTYGRISFAVIADRQFKSGPEGKVPATGSRGDHVLDPNFDPRTADRPGLELLGERQLRFLRDWAADWRGAEMKAVISQTVFTAMATTHGGNREVLRADYDANGWPQTPRNDALRAIRKAFAVHIAGDQHLPAVVHYGVDGPRDAGVAFAGPALNVGYPRWFEPARPGQNRAAGAPENTGDFLDSFGNPMTVLAVANGPVRARPKLLEQLQDRTSGLGLVRFDKKRRTITLECWPILADVTRPGTQFPGWPVTIHQLDNYARKPEAHLPRLNVGGVDQPVLQVIEEASGEVVYTLRLAGPSFQPHVFAAGLYTVKLSEPETGKFKELRGLAARAGNDTTIDVTV